ncbi:MAG: family 10 glycosylhydrolase, partial [Candidatus Izimaplasma sp.]|nr:family 10 glycosylhydrolase [Candidatus Izimaplasma bacterium]
MKISKMLLTIMVVFLVIAGTSSNQIYSSDDLEVLVRDGVTETHFQTTDPVMIPTTYTEKSEEFRGVWVATVWNLNMPQHTSETQYKTAFVELIDEVLAANMNAILFQVRPQNDAFYDSEYAPWSKWLTGTEGQDPGWDVMQYMIDYSHAHGIEFHAWLNPYRVTNSSSDKTTMLDTLHAENWAKINPDMVVAGNMDSHGRHPYILNPGEPAVKTYIRNVVTELITLYDVDGIHFD